MVERPLSEFVFGKKLRGFSARRTWGILPLIIVLLLGMGLVFGCGSAEEEGDGGHRSSSDRVSEAAATKSEIGKWWMEATALTNRLGWVCLQSGRSVAGGVFFKGAQIWPR